MAATPQILKTIIFTLGGTDFSDDVIDAEVVAAPGDVQKVTTLDGVVHQDAAPVSWALRLRAVIDWDSGRPGLAYYLYDSAGDAVTFTLKDTTAANSASKPLITGTCTLVPISYGGSGNVFAEVEVSLPITGTPTLDATP